MVENIVGTVLWASAFILIGYVWILVVAFKNAIEIGVGLLAIFVMSALFGEIGLLGMILTWGRLIAFVGYGIAHFKQCGLALFMLLVGFIAPMILVVEIAGKTS